MINGSEESMAFDGFLWTQAPVCNCISIVIGNDKFYFCISIGLGYVVIYKVNDKWNRRINGFC